MKNITITPTSTPTSVPKEENLITLKSVVIGKVIPMADADDDTILYMASTNPTNAATALGMGFMASGMNNMRICIFGKGGTEESAIRDAFRAEKAGRALEIEILTKLQTEMFGPDFDDEDPAESLRIESLKEKIAGLEYRISELEDEVEEVESECSGYTLTIKNGEAHLLEYIQDRMRCGYELFEVVYEKFREHEMIVPVGRAA